MRNLPTQRLSSSYKTIQNFNVHSYRNFVDLAKLTSGSVHVLKIVLLSFLLTFATNFDVIF